MADAPDERTAIPPVWLEPADLRILRFLRERGPTFHINISKATPHDIHHVSRRCKYLASRDLLERRSLTYYALTERGEELLDGVDGGAAAAGSDDRTATGS